jgi:hypothetical protein
MDPFESTWVSEDVDEGGVSAAAALTDGTGCAFGETVTKVLTARALALTLDEEEEEEETASIPPDVTFWFGGGGGGRMGLFLACQFL